MAGGDLGEGLPTVPIWHKAHFKGSTVLRSCCLLLQILLPLPACCETVHHGPVREGALGGGAVLGPPGPGFLRRCLECSAIAEGQSPRQAADTVLPLALLV